MARRLGERVGQGIGHPGLSVRRSRHPPRAHQPGEHPARAVRRAQGGDRNEPGTPAGLRPRPARAGRGHRHRGAPAADRLQRLPGHATMSASPKPSPRRSAQSSGGLPSVKALGMLVEGRAQVSMNLTNFHQTSVKTVVEAIRSEAAQHGNGHPSQRTDRADPAGGPDRLGRPVPATGRIPARTDPGTATVRSCRAACTCTGPDLPGRPGGRHPHSGRRFGCRAGRGDGRGAGGHGGPPDDRQEKVRRSRSSR